MRTLQNLQLMVAGLGLPPIRGRWYGVDPGGVTLGTAPRHLGLAAVYTHLKDAYDACVSGAGDGIVDFSSSASTTTYSDEMLAPFTWSKWNITVVAVATGGYNSRSRVVSHQAATSAVAVVMNATAQTIVRADAGSFITDGWKVGMTGVFDGAGTNANRPFTITAVVALTMTCTAADVLTETSTSHTLVGYFPYLIDVSGSNNRFYGMYFINEASHALNVGAVSDSGNRNKFVDCHFNNVGALQAAVTGLYDFRLSASEVQFVHCWFGNNNVARTAANGNILLGLSTTQIGQNYFEDCYILSTSNTAGHGGIKIADVATLGGFVTFKKCKFQNWYSGAKTALTTVIIGATPNNLGIDLGGSTEIGWAAWGANDDTWYTVGAASAAGTGGIGGTIA